MLKLEGIQTVLIIGREAIKHEHLLDQWGEGPYHSELYRGEEAKACHQYPEP